MSISPPIPEIRLLQNLNLKIQGQGHGIGELWKSHHGTNILSTHIPFIPCQSALPFLRCDFFKFLPWKFKVKVMVEVKVENHKVGATSYQLTSLLFHVNRPSHSWDTAFSKYDLENPRSRSWVRGMLKVTTWVQHSIDSHPFHSMSIGHPIPEIRLLEFKNLTLKIQGPGHGWGQSWKSQSGCNILSTHIPFIPCQSALPFLRYSIFKIWPWKSTVKVMGAGNIESHNMGPTFYHIPFIPCQWAIPFLRYDFFKIWPWKSKIKVMGEGNVESHKVGVTSYWLTSLSFHVNQLFHSWETAFSKFDLENPRSRSNDHGVAQLQV